MGTRPAAGLPRAPSFEEALRAGRLLFDGPLGTELLSRGHRAPLEELNASAPAVIGEIHRAYVAAGARVLRANTLLARRTQVSGAARLAALGIALARETASPATWVGAPIGAPLRTASAGEGDMGVFRDAVLQQAESCREADFLVLESFLRPDDLDAALSAAGRAYRGPLIACWTLRSDLPTRLDAMSTQRLYATLGRFLEVASRSRIAAVGLNCVPPGGLLERARDFLVRESPWPWGILPAAAPPAGGRASLRAPRRAAGAPGSGERRDRELVAACEAALATGAAYVGACCGAGPDTIRRLRSALSPPAPRHDPARRRAPSSTDRAGARPHPGGRRDSRRRPSEHTKGRTGAAGRGHAARAADPAKPRAGRPPAGRDHSTRPPGRRREPPHSGSPRGRREPPGSGSPRGRRREPPGSGSPRAESRRHDEAREGSWKPASRRWEREPPPAAGENAHA